MKIWKDFRVRSYSGICPILILTRWLFLPVGQELPIYWDQFFFFFGCNNVWGLNFENNQISRLPLQSISICPNVLPIFWLLISWIPGLGPLFLTDFLSFYISLYLLEFSDPAFLDHHLVPFLSSSSIFIITVHSHATLSLDLQLSSLERSSLWIKRSYS